ncbi:glycosyltransferase family 4 protein [Flavivirga algicola]|uniref:Glycosyltransferase n=1 Tax=Flavivirga algicola TaxID=2729136 RepID=A0ABX1RWV4_9FLAO|nr:glycosyltransferase [Flavivirga algicola]NMH87636.1 glycosyltransferase [Flavivirga algicola]
MNKRFKILVSCYACSPYRGSEPGMGWRFVLGLSKHHDIHVITEKEKWEKEIKQFIEAERITNIHFYFIKKKRNRTLRKIWPPSYYWFYKGWQKQAYRLVQQLDEKEDFDLIHQLNMVGYREPGYLWKINKPFVWGPIGGTQDVPWHLFSVFNFYGKLFYGGRNIVNTIQKHFLSRPRLAAKKQPSALIAATPDIQKDILRLWNAPSEIITEIGTDDSLNIQVNDREKEAPLKIIWSGQHTSGKALNILLKSLALLDSHINWQLDILGVGKETNSWKSLANKLNISSNCKWHGWIPKDNALNIMESGHVLCITSLKDLTSTITLEGISLGLPIICLDHCGFAYVVNESCGIKIKMGGLKHIQNDFKEAIELLYNDENLRKKLAIGALRRAKDFLWKENIEKLNTIYLNLLR